MGQAKKRRFCPAVQKDITAIECGENRISHYACPESCPYNPFSAANYDAQLELENRLDEALVQTSARDPGMMAQVAERLGGALAKHPIHGQHAAIVRHFFFDRDASGRTFVERGLAEGVLRLRNDEQVTLRAKMQMRVALLEIRQIVNDREFYAVDLLKPGSEPMRFVDRAIAATTVRFATMLAWVFPMPHFWRASGSMLDLADVCPLPALDVLEECIRHLHGPADPAARRSWLAENFVRIDEVIGATATARRRDMLAKIDAYFGAATYESRATAAEIHRVLSNTANVEPVEPSAQEKSDGFDAAYVWFDLVRQKNRTVPGRLLIGRVLLCAKAVRVEAVGAWCLDELKQKFEALLGPLVAFSKERRDNLGAQALAAMPEVDTALVPPRLLDNPTQLDVASSQLPERSPGVESDASEAAIALEMAWKTLDEHVPALGGLTPREAAANPECRAQLCEWVKGFVRMHDHRNLSTGRTDDINPLIRALGLAELDVPPPPLRAIPEDADDFDAEDEWDDDPDDFEEETHEPGLGGSPF